MPFNAALVAAPLGRFLFALIFVASAAGKLAGWQNATDMMAAKGVPAVDMLLSIAIVLELVGGILVILGFHTRYGAVLLLAFMVPVSLIMHNFWAVPEAQQQEQMIYFMKNVSIIGGLLVLVALGAGPVSVDNWRQRKPVVRT